MARWPWRIVDISTGKTMSGSSVVGYSVVALYCPHCAHDGLSDVTSFGDESPSYICRRCKSHFTAPTREELMA